VVVFMPNGLPRGPTGKLHRIGFAKRARLPTLSDSSSSSSSAAFASAAANAADTAADTAAAESAVLFEAEVAGALGGGSNALDRVQCSSIR
jgi:hypothetical protein